MSEWISIDDRFPDESGWYKCKIEAGSIKKEIHIRDKTMFKKQWNRFIVGDWQKVTHWMPLPESPEDV